jgi:hypothetical protein
MVQMKKWRYNKAAVPGPLACHTKGQLSQMVCAVFDLCTPIFELAQVSGDRD